MSDQSVRLQRLHIRRMPGTPHPGFELAPLHPRVTLITGPNGSGKTTAGRAVEAVLGGASFLSGGSIGAELLLQGQLWTVDLEGRSAQWMCGGHSQPAPELASAGSAALHRIALPDLLDPAGGGHDHAAQRVAQAMAGGFDLARLRSELQADDRPRGVANARRDLESEQQRLRDAQQDAIRLDRRSQEELPRLHREIAAAETAAAQVGHLEVALRLAQHREQAAELEARRAAQEVTAEQLAVVLDDDPARARKLDEDVARRRAAVQDFQREIEALLPAEGEERAPRRDLPDQLRDAAEHLRTLHAERSRAEQQERAAIGRRDDVLARCAESVADLPLAAQSIANVSAPLTDLAQRSVEVAAEVEVLRRLSDALGEPETLAKQSERVEALRGGIDDLTRWLRFARDSEPDGVSTASAGASAQPAGQRLAFVLILTAAGALGWLLLSVIVDPAWSAGALLMVALGAAVMWWMKRGSGVPAPAAMDAGHTDALLREAAERYRARDLPQPPKWTPDIIARHLELIVHDFAAALHAHEALRRIQELAPRRDRAQQARAAIDAQRAETERTLGVRLPGDSLAPAWLGAIADAVRSWQKAHEEAVGCGAQAAAIAEDIAAQERAVRALLEEARLPVDLQPAAIFRAADRVRAMVDAADNVQRLRQERERGAVPELRQAETALAAFWSRRALSSGDLVALLGLVGRVRAVRDLDLEIRDIRVLIEQDAGALAGAPDALLEKPPHELEQELAGAALRRNAFAQLIDDRARLRADIERAGSGTTIAAAQAAVDQATAALDDLRAEEIRRAISGTIIARIAAISRQRTMPRVFHRAIALFSSFTAGRYELEMDAEGTTPTFSALDRVDGLRKSLDQLSSGERVQLLLAVRLAFIDEEERGQSLPIVLDEVLATSDDLRAGAIMQAVLEVVRGGRQVIILTAQHDERAKWCAALQDAGLEFAEIDLEQVRNLPHAEHRPLAPALVDRPRVAEPTNMDHAAYGRALQVGGLDPWSNGGADAAHLWYAVEDSAMLHALLSAGVRTIGQLLGYIRAVGRAPCGDDERVTTRARASHAGITEAMRAWRIGRTPPVSFEELLGSDAISDVFQERLGALYRDLQYDPAAFLQVLELRDDPRVRGFRERYTEQLRDYMTEKGWLSQVQPLDRAALRLRVRGAVHDALHRGELDEVWIDDVLAGLPQI